jgi:hypothetical protein
MSQFFFLKNICDGCEMIIFPFGVASLGVGRRVVGGGGGPCVDERLNDHALFFFLRGGFGLRAPPHNKTAHLCGSTIPETSASSTLGLCYPPEHHPSETPVMTQLPIKSQLSYHGSTLVTYLVSPPRIRGPPLPSPNYPWKCATIA